MSTHEKFTPHTFSPQKKKRGGTNFVIVVLQVLGVVAAVSLLLFFLLSEDQDKNFPADQGAQVLRWARMNPPPEGSKNFQFSNPDENPQRMFVYSFQPPSETAFRRWQIQSPGTEKLTPKRDGLGVQLYIIEPKLPGDRYVEIRYDENANTVSISAAVRALGGL